MTISCGAPAGRAGLDPEGSARGRSGQLLGQARHKKEHLFPNCSCCVACHSPGSSRAAPGRAGSGRNSDFSVHRLGEVHNNAQFVLKCAHWFRIPCTLGALVCSLLLHPVPVHTGMHTSCTPSGLALSAHFVHTLCTLCAHFVHTEIIVKSSVHSMVEGLCTLGPNVQSVYVCTLLAKCAPPSQLRLMKSFVLSVLLHGLLPRPSRTSPHFPIGACLS